MPNGESKERRGAVTNIVRGSIRYKSIFRLVLVVFGIVGIVGLAKMNKDELPTFEITQGLVAAVYPGADVQQVEQEVGKPLEQMLFTFSEVNRETTKVVSKDGMCYIYVDLLSPSAKKDEVWSKIKLKIDSFKSSLPAGVLAVVVMGDFSALTSVLVAMVSEDKGYSELQEYADDFCDRLKKIPTLSNVSVSGLQQEEIAVEIDPERLAAYGISPASLVWNYQTSTLQTLGGSFTTDYANSPIHVPGTVSTEEQLYNKIVYSSPGGEVLRLRDIATVERRHAAPSSLAEYNGTPAVIFSIEMRPDNDIVSFGKEVDRVMAEFESGLPDSVTLSKITDQPKVVGSSVWSFLRDLVISMLVVIAVMLLLFPLKSALIASSAVPVCTAIALAIMFLTDIPLNTVSLAALIVVLGMIVDDSVITMDGYMDKIGRGMTRMQAACSSAQELFMPMLIATSAISLMFFPAKKLITGYLGEFVGTFPWVVAFSLMTSLAYAILVVPSLEVKFIGQSTPDKENFLSRIQAKLFVGMQKGYEFLQTKCFRHPWITVGIGVGTVVLGLVMFSQSSIQMMPMAPRPIFAVEVYLDPSCGLDRTQKVADSLSTLLRRDPRVVSVTEFIGTGTPRFHATYAPVLPGPNVAQLIVNTKSNLATEEVLKEYESAYEHIFPEAFIHFKQMDYQGTSTPVEFKVSGDDYAEVKEVADRIEAYMHTLDGLKWVHSDADFMTSAIRLDLDGDQASRLGVNRSMMNLSLAGSTAGVPLMTVREGNSEIPVRLYGSMLGPDSGYDEIGNTLVPTSLPGVMVPLRQVTQMSPEWFPESLCRQNGQTCISVGADTRIGAGQPAISKKIERYIEKNIELPEGVSVTAGGLSSTNRAIIPEIVMAFFAAVAVLFFFLLLHFKKVSLAVLTIILSCLCLFGAFFGLWIFKLDFSMTAVLGLISLVGIIVRNGIILFEYAEELHYVKKIPLKEAAEEAGKRRMRPIFLTSCTTALGVLPMILSGDLMWMPMGVVICFGTLLSVLLITLIMPVSYWLIFRRHDAKISRQQ